MNLTDLRRYLKPAREACSFMNAANTQESAQRAFLAYHECIQKILNRIDRDRSFLNSKKTISNNKRKCSFFGVIAPYYEDRRCQAFTTRNHDYCVAHRHLRNTKYMYLIDYDKPPTEDNILF